MDDNNYLDLLNNLSIKDFEILSIHELNQIIILATNELSRRAMDEIRKHDTDRNKNST